jgi:hypothetical protein
MCPEAEVNLVYEDPWLFPVEDSARFPMTLQYPLDCRENNAFRGNMVVNLENPDVLPGYDLLVEGKGLQAATWTNPFAPPANGAVSIHLLAVVDSAALGPPPPDVYVLRINVSFSPPVPNSTAPTSEKTFEVRIQVVDSKLDIVIVEPNREKTYPSSPPNWGDYLVAVEVSVISQENDIASVSYRLDNEPWTQLTYQNRQTVNLDTSLVILPPYGGKHLFTVRAETVNGDTLTRMEPFNISFGGNQALNIVRWDGGGDGIHWHDAQNWEGDRVPGRRDRAIVDLPGTDLVVIRPPNPSSQEYLFNIGAFNVKASLTLASTTVLRVYSAKDSSYITGSLRFVQPSYLFEAPRISYVADQGNHRIMVTDTLYLSNVVIENTQDQSITLESEGIAYDGAVPTANPRAVFIGRTTLQLEGETFNYRPFYFLFDDKDGLGDFYNAGEWHIFDDLSIQTYSTQSHLDLINFGTINIERNKPNATLTLERVRLTTAIPTGGINDTTGAFTHLGKIDCQNCKGSINQIRTNSDITLEGGPGPISVGLGVKAPKLHLKGTPTEKLGFLAFGHKTGIREIVLENAILTTDGSILNEFPPDAAFRARKVVMSTGAELFARRNSHPSSAQDPIRATLDSLVMFDGVVTIGAGDTLETSYLDWKRGTFEGNDSSMLYFRANPDGAVSVLRPPTSEAVFKGAITIGPQAEVRWESGLMRGIPFTPTWMYIKPGGVFRIDGTYRYLTWNLPYLGQDQGHLMMENEGLVEKIGGNAAEIQGCLKLINGGIFSQPGTGQLQLVAQGNPNFTCN